MNLYVNMFGFFIFISTLLLFCIFSVKIFTFFINKKHFPKRLLISVLTGTLVCFGLFVYANYLFTFNHLEGESYKEPVHSPSEKYTANAYYMTYGGAAGGVNIWIDIMDHDEKDRIETVYYSNAKSNFSMEWKDEQTLSIKNEEPGSNSSIDLEIGKEIYHESGNACRSWLLKEKYEACYQDE